MPVIRPPWTTLRSATHGSDAVLPQPRKMRLQLGGRLRVPWLTNHASLLSRAYVLQPNITNRRKPCTPQPMTDVRSAGHGGQGGCGGSCGGS